MCVCECLFLSTSFFPVHVSLLCFKCSACAFVPCTLDLSRGKWGTGEHSHTHTYSFETGKRLFMLIRSRSRSLNPTIASSLCGCFPLFLFPPKTGPHTLCYPLSSSLISLPSSLTWFFKRSLFHPETHSAMQFEIANVILWVASLNLPLDTFLPLSLSPFFLLNPSQAAFLPILVSRDVTAR